MRTTEARRGRPDRSRVGATRNVEVPDPTFTRFVAPSWETAARPTTPALGDFGLNTDEGHHEIYDGADWVAAAGVSEEVTFTGTSSYTYTHDLGTRPDVSVLLASGVEVEVDVVHVNANTLTIYFNGTLTDAVLTLT